MKMTTQVLFQLLVLLPLTLPQTISAELFSLWKHNDPHILGRRGNDIDHVLSRKRYFNDEDPGSNFKPGPWKNAHATFYEGGSGTFGGACGYEDTVKNGYGLETAALSTALFNSGRTCGACYEIQCKDDPEWCQPGEPSLLITATNLCPPNYALPSDNGGWCNPPQEHFDLAKPVFTKLATDYKAGVIPVRYRRVPCQKTGGVKFTLTGNPYFLQVQVWNVAGAGEVVSVQVKGSKSEWTQMKRLWGQKWETDLNLVGQSLTFKVQTADGRTSIVEETAPSNWQFGQTYEGQNFR